MVSRKIEVDVHNQAISWQYVVVLWWLIRTTNPPMVRTCREAQVSATFL